jgi:hypothetical protein
MMRGMRAVRGGEPRSSRRGDPGVKGGFFARHLDGWQAGVVAVAIALAGAFLAVPHPVAPVEIPAPAVDEAALARTIAADRARAEAIAPSLARELEGKTTDTSFYDLRALGSALRAFGLVDANGEMTELVDTRAKLVRAVDAARRLGPDRLLALRAYEECEFLAEVRRFERTGVASDELKALGGGFIGMLERNGWLRGRTVIPDEAVRATMFKRRWNELTGLGDGPFALTLDEMRAFYRFLLAHPGTEAASGTPGMVADCRVIDQWRLRKVDELATIDPSYPRLLARGVLLYRLGQSVAAVQALRDYLEARGDGAYALRARNYLDAALERAAER